MFHAIKNISTAFLLQAVCHLTIIHANGNTENLDHYLRTHGYHLSPVHSTINEGYSSEAQRLAFRDELMKLPQIKRIAEIGFNAGHSCELFLETCENAEVLSFDIDWHLYTRVGMEYMRNKFTDRFSFIIGDSRYTVPEYTRNHPGELFDLIFIDGNHSFDFIFSDIYNCRQLAHENTILWIDDYNAPDVKRAVALCKKRKLIGHIQSKTADDSDGHRSWAIAKYLFH